MSKCDAKLPTLYLPIEIKPREFKAKVLLALVAANRGFRVYLGTKASINRLVNRKAEKGGIYFYKGGKHDLALRKIKSVSDYFVVLDEELGPAVQDLEYAYRRRIYPGTEALVDKLFVIGAHHLDVISKVRPQLLHAVEVTGWPRVDLWRKQFRTHYASEISYLRKQYDDYILFSSDFGILSEEVIENEMIRLRKVESTEEEYNYYESSMRAAYEDFLTFINLVKRLDNDEEFPSVIIRPHPAEDIRIWLKHLNGLTRVKVIYEGEISPWLYAARGLLHRGCTTAIQASIADVPVLYWTGGKSAVKKETLSYLMSSPVADYEALKSSCLDIISGNFKFSPDISIDDRVFLGKNLACERIVESLSSMKVTAELPFRLDRTERGLRFLLGYAGEYCRARGWGRDKARLNALRRKMSGGIHLQEVRDVAQALMPNFSGSFLECDFNVVEVCCCS
ncbi:surface carbohydrate biosynthesis protein [Ectopseudomonas mendocina]|uniref:surface carbohydrate biosynthesis protein n=1 Tax=Ectopseudomonas mendocina TaxID=300 RepID=UPI00376EB64E